MPRRGARPVLQLVGNLAKIALPLVAIAAAALWFLNLDSSPTGELRVTTTIPGAEIHIDGVQTGALSDTLLSTVPAGRRFVTVRAPGMISDPEMLIVEVQKGRTAVAAFVLTDSLKAVRTDSIPGSRRVRQDIFADGSSAVHAIPPAPGRPRMLDFSDPSADDRSITDIAQRPPVQGSAGELRDDLSISEPSGVEAARQSLSGTQISVTSDPPGASIIVNGARTTNVTPYTYRGLDRGYYVFALELSGHIVAPDSIEIFLNQDGQSELASFALESAHTLPAPQLTIATRPLAAGIRVNGTAVGVGSAKLSPAYGDVLIEFAAVPGYKSPDPVKLSITKDRPNHDISGAYERLSGEAMLAVVPNHNFVKFDGSKLRVFVDGELILDGPKEKFDATLLGSLYPGERAVKVEYDGLTYEEIVKLSDGQVAEATIRVDAMFGKRKLRFKTNTDIPLDKWQSRFKKSSVLEQS